MVLNTTFNNISAISWQSALLKKEMIVVFSQLHCICYKVSNAATFFIKQTLPDFFVLPVGRDVGDFIF
jgi:hypothetical protein